ncbi:MAG: class I SAM-dependent methyltransferase [Chloroflexota bacterium]|nr:class I SAM-dependent methyltransferase [Chloroflexota bacterium]
MKSRLRVSMGIYQAYAPLYDLSGQTAFSQRMLPYLRRLLTCHVVDGKRMVDVACGTGTVGLGLAEDGWCVYGVDASRDMLAAARAKAQGKRASVTWSRQDMRAFNLPQRVHLATCLYDSMNYMLTEDDLKACFTCVFDVLLPGGLFLFDMNTIKALCEVWNGKNYVVDSDDLYVVLRSRYSRRQERSYVEVNCFQRVGTFYRRVTEEHVEQGYPKEQINALLTEAGFAVEAAYECFSFQPPSDETLRIMWAARRPR